MGLKVGNLDVKTIKLGVRNINAVFLGNLKIWPTEVDLNPDELVQALACFSLGHWEDVLPWKDILPWFDNY